MSKNFKLNIILIVLFILALPLLTEADAFGQRVNFLVNSSYDLNKRNQLTATLQKVSPRIYFYIDDIWWNALDFNKQQKISTALDALFTEFDYKIYPTLTSTFGLEPKPGIDKDDRITVLIHPMVEEAGGYFNPGDEYPKIQSPNSNEREIIYLNAQYIDKPLIKSLLAHEFTHLITFNQKDLLRKVSEETWLAEARSEYASTLLGYDNVYAGSNLERRVKNFLEKSNDSVTEWQNQKYDYGVVNLFTQYLVDHYGLKILVDSLLSSKVGIPSLNEALAKNGFQDDFAQIFTNWTIATVVNDCALGYRYCYLNPNLTTFRITPLINFLPLVGESSLSITHRTTNWAGNWQKIVGGKGALTLEFDGSDEVKFRVPYLVCDYQGKCTVELLNLDNYQKGKINISEFNIKYTSLTIIPSIQSKISGFDNQEPSYLFFWKASTVEKTQEELEKEQREQLLAQIDFLQKEIAKIQAQIDSILGTHQESISCQKLENNLYFGMKNSAEVSCLQKFLQSQGSEIYPEGLITGNFLSLTQQAVIRFQEKYADEVLKPLGLASGTGFVGSLTRTKINQLTGS